MAPITMESKSTKKKKERKKVLHIGLFDIKLYRTPLTIAYTIDYQQKGLLN
jgi:hypothetical protein